MLTERLLEELPAIEARIVAEDLEIFRLLA